MEECSQNIICSWIHKQIPVRIKLPSHLPRWTMFGLLIFILRTRRKQTTNRSPWKSIRMGTLLTLPCKSSLLCISAILVCTRIKYASWNSCIAILCILSRVKVTFLCSMNLRSFPHDTQTCDLRISSCKRPTKIS